MRVLADGRVRRSAGEWEKIIGRYRKSRLSVSAFCEKEEISRGSLRTWNRRLKGEAKKRPALQKRPGFVEIVRPAKKSAVSPSTVPHETSFELTFPGGVTLRWKGSLHEMA